MYQESRFDPKARSFAGARGLLQVMPRTARELGYTNLEDPETGIRAGLDYLAWVRERFDDQLTTSERTWLTLAAYNVGSGHVRDAQRIAADRGLDPNRWFGHVEQALLLKQKPEVHRKTRYGYARASEPVAYVRAIRDRYEAYVHSGAGS
jgi:membrane-bound lytic murein transglycosylase F